ncbi:MAG TPA: NADH-quinone oxidoreductase subunit NuoF [Thermoanaerobaculaceae bacterium]|nr:NADH-quinone oxidoreductase subunit NuoF [Thermoanaerobaculaceae bacterium]HRS17095.1 NADH-quinone oxidoreductase subunit NuoF [Thermoanaerobaculaceae bacterium]
MEVLVGLGTCGIAAGAEHTFRALESKLGGDGPRFALSKTGCIGMCYREPLVEIRHDDGIRYQYGGVSADRVDRLVAEHLGEGRVIEDWLVWSDDGRGSERAYFTNQTRIVLRNCGKINPEAFEDYLAAGGYQALQKVLAAGDPEGLIATITDSGLRGRGGAGFLTGMKWRFTRLAAGSRKFVICNADEGDPGAFMDRSVLESDPHAVLEGMAIAAFAIGAREGYIYVRAEYPKAIERLNIAIAQAEARGFLGDRILGTDFGLHIKLKEGAGAFVCGEETALIGSIEGKRGMPRVRPPFPAVKGLWDCPTSINNVETFANVPWIVLNGAAAFAAMGTANSKGTKVFAMAGKVVRGGLVEVPMGISIREIVFEVCGGIKDGKKFKAVQMGGPSGGCIPAELQNTVIDYESINKTGAIMGSGGLVVMDETTCMVDVARFFLDFTQRESCGKCTFCRVGTKRMLEVLTRITEGKGKEGDIELLEQLASLVKNTSLCGLGQTAPNPVLTTLKYFRSEYEAHIINRKCPAHRCQALLSYTINAKCTGCTVCARVCPTKCISGEVKKPHVIDQSKCIHCGECHKACRFAAIAVD